MIPTSVIVVSRGRPAHLRRCLMGLSQLWYDPFEVVVVTDPVGQRSVQSCGFEGRVKLVLFDEANISKARNLGVEAASGEVVAFIDDDSVPEPSWLEHLIAPFEDSKIVQTGGYVRGRNGISFQWRARVVDAEGHARDVAHEGDAPFMPKTDRDEAIKTEGTNMALRRKVLAQIGGFDPAFRFFYDETDVNRRLMGKPTLIVPLAQVHHGFAASRNRAASRAALDLTDIGASTAVFLRKHAGEPANKVVARREQVARLSDQQARRLISAKEKSRLLETFDAGFEAGLSRPIEPLPPLGPPPDDFLAFTPDSNGTGLFLAGRSLRRRSLRAQARAAVARGDVVTLLLLSPDARPHWMRFHDDGYWEQKGGLFGRSIRSGPRLMLTSFAERRKKEHLRIKKLRKL